MDPHTGNALLAYARLNVPYVRNRLYNEPLAASHFAQPSLVDMSPGLDVRAARYHADARTLHISLRAGRCRDERFSLFFANILERGRWALLVDGEVAAEVDAREIGRAHV